MSITFGANWGANTSRAAPRTLVGSCRHCPCSTDPNGPGFPWLKCCVSGAKTLAMWGSCGIFCMGAGWILALICLWSVEFRYMYAWLCMPFCWMYPAPDQSNSFEISMRSCNWLNRKHTAAPHAQYPAFHQSIASGHDKEATSEAAIDIEIIAWKKVNIYRETTRHPVDALKIADPLAIRCSFPCMSHLFSPVLTYSHLFVYILVTTLVAVQNPLGQGKSGGRWKMIYTLYIKRGCCQKIFEWAWSAGTMFIIQWSPWELMLYMDNDHHPKGLPGGSRWLPSPPGQRTSPAPGDRVASALPSTPLSIFSRPPAPSPWPLPASPSSARVPSKWRAASSQESTLWELPLLLCSSPAAGPSSGALPLPLVLLSVPFLLFFDAAPEISTSLPVVFSFWLFPGPGPLPLISVFPLSRSLLRCPSGRWLNGLCWSLSPAFVALLEVLGSWPPDGDRAKSKNLRVLGRVMINSSLRILAFPLSPVQRRSLRNPDPLWVFLFFTSFLTCGCRSHLHSRLSLPLLVFLVFLLLLNFSCPFYVLLFLWLLSSSRRTLGGCRLLLSSLLYPTVRGNCPRRTTGSKDPVLLHEITNLPCSHTQSAHHPAFDRRGQLVALDQEVDSRERSTGRARVTQEVVAPTTQHQLKPTHFSATLSAFIFTTGSELHIITYIIYIDVYIYIIYMSYIIILIIYLVHLVIYLC